MTMSRLAELRGEIDAVNRGLLDLPSFAALVAGLRL